MTGAWLQARIDVGVLRGQLLWMAIYGVVGLLLVRFVNGIWIWQGATAKHGRRYYVAAVGLWALAVILSLVFGSG